MIIQIVMGLIFIAFNFRLVHGLINNLISVKGVNDIAYATSIRYDFNYIFFNHLDYGVLKYATVFLIPLFIWLSVTRMKSKSVNMFALSSVISFMIVYGYLFGRIDATGLNRIGSFSIMILCFYVPIIVKQEYKNKHNSLIVLIPMIVLLLSRTPIRVNFETGNKFMGADAIFVEKEVLPKLGVGFIDPETHNYLVTLDKVFGQYLVKSNQTFYDFTNQSSLYYIFDKRVPGIYSSSYLTIGSQIENMTIEKLKHEDIPLVLIGPKNIQFDNVLAPMRSYRIYKYFIDKGYQYSEIDGIQFLVRDDLDLDSEEELLVDIISISDITDDNWLHGILRNGKTLLVENKPLYKEIINNSSNLILLDNKKFTVSSVNESGMYLHINIVEVVDLEVDLPKVVKTDKPYTIKKEDTIIYDVSSIFLKTDFGYLPSSWGRSYKVLMKNIKKIENKYSTRVIENNNSMISKIISLKGKDLSENSDYLFISLNQFESKSLPKNAFDLEKIPLGRISWTYDGENYKNTDYVEFKILNDKLIVPLGSSPSWSMKKGVKALKIVITKNNNNIDQIDFEFWRLNDYDANN